MSDADKKTIQLLHNMLDLVTVTRNHITRPPGGCACDQAGMCLLHGQAYKRLTTIADEIARAIGDLQND